MPGIAVQNTHTNHAGGQAQIGGKGFIAGTMPGIVTAGGAPARKRVHLFDQPTGRRVSSTLSAEDGTYRFDNLNPARLFYLVAFDDERRFNAVIRDRIQPVLP